MKLTLEQFCAKVNELSKRESDRLNAKFKAGKLLFPASYLEYPVGMLSNYFEKGMTPNKTWDTIRFAD